MYSTIDRILKSKEETPGMCIRSKNNTRSDAFFTDIVKLIAKYYPDKDEKKVERVEVKPDFDINIRKYEIKIQYVDSSSEEVYLELLPTRPQKKVEKDPKDKVVKRWIVKTQIVYLKFKDNETKQLIRDEVVELFNKEMG